MAKNFDSPERRSQTSPQLAAEGEATAPGGKQFVAVRETIESIVVAFALAFLIRTFEAEAFVIPTGSMSPALLGMHKDVNCAQCGYRFRASASSEDAEEAVRRGIRDTREAEVVAGVCPMCRYPMPMRRDAPEPILAAVGAKPDDVAFWRTYPGDRILVNKFGFDFHDPKRWDVVVFKFPGNGNMNYIKRLVGMPNESLRVQFGDVFTRPKGDRDAEFKIERRPAEKVSAMLQPVHDSAFEPVKLFNAGWPLRWAATTPNGWQIQAEADEQLVRQRFTIDGKPDAPIAWLRYRHQLPTQLAWRVAVERARTGSFEELARNEGISSAQAEAAFKQHAHPELISDFNPYDARVERKEVAPVGIWDFQRAPWPVWSRLGANWVGDLGLECDVDAAEPRGELVLDVVEAGYHFRATINLETGKADLGIVDGRTGEALDFHASADTPIRGGAHNVKFANVDDELWLWVDGKQVKFEDATYDPDKLFAGGRRGMIPWTSPEENGDQGDLSPVGVGARGAKLEVSRLAVFRDIYYIAAKATKTQMEGTYSFDYAPPGLPDTGPNGERIPALDSPFDLLSQPAAWPRLLNRRGVEFETEDNQFFMMGDNSPESKDSRLWMRRDTLAEGLPGGAYVDRELLIGKALLVFWPHSWGAVPGLPKLPGFPNFGDMRRVK